MTRTIITGGSRTGKTTLAAQICGSHPVWHTDSLVELPWSEQSNTVACWLQHPGPWIIDGCAATRALRKWLDLADDGVPPCEVIIRCVRPVVERTKGQETLSRGEATIWAQIEIELVARGVQIHTLA